MPNYPANGQIGLAVINGRLVLAWGDKNTNALTTSWSADGVHWSTPQAFGSLPLVYSVTNAVDPPPYESGGVNMTSSSPCGYAYAAYLGTNGSSIYGARSSDGVNWDGGHLIWSAASPPGYSSPGTSTPALYGAFTNGTVGFAFPVYSGTAQQPEGASGSVSTIGYKLELGQFNCDFSGPQLLSKQCFFWDSATGTCQDASLSPQYPVSNPNLIMEFDEGLPDFEENLTYIDTPTGPWTPLWTGAGGVELRAVAQGNPLVYNAQPPIFYTLNEGALACQGITNCPPSDYHADAAGWSNAGVGGAVDPASGTPFIVWTCGSVWNYKNGGTCDNSSVMHIHIEDLSNGHVWTAPYDWAMVKPSATFLNNRLWVAWCGDYGCSGTLNVASIFPAQVTGCTYSLQQAYYLPGSGGPYTDSVSTTGTDCVWSANSDSGWIAITGGANSTGNATFTFSATQNPGAPLAGTITAVDDKTVAIHQGTVGGSPGTGSVTIYGSPNEQTVNECPNTYPYNCWETIWEYGTVSVTVNGQIFTVQYGGPDWTDDSLASSLASQINSQPPYSAISATVSGSAVTIRSTVNGANTNYPVSASYTYASGFSGPAATAYASGASLAGGTN